MSRDGYSIQPYCRLFTYTLNFLAAAETIKVVYSVPIWIWAIGFRNPTGSPVISVRFDAHNEQTPETSVTGGATFQQATQAVYMSSANAPHYYFNCPIYCRTILFIGSAAINNLSVNIYYGGTA
jgi:hypothetical protein